MLTREEVEAMPAGDLAVYNNDPISLVLRWAKVDDLEVSGDYISARRDQLKKMGN